MGPARALRVSLLLCVGGWALGCDRGAPSPDATPPDVPTMDSRTPEDQAVDTGTPTPDFTALQDTTSPDTDATVLDTLGVLDGTDVTDASAPDTSLAAPDADPRDLPMDAPLDAPPDAPDAHADAVSEGYVRPPAVDVPTLPPRDADALPFPRTDAGTLVVYRGSGVRIELDPTRRNAVSAHAACLELVVTCVAPPARSLDACATSAPRCGTARPWEESAACCPAGCADQYEAERRRGLDPLAAFREVYIERRTCFPELLATLGLRP
ncbi:MAG: hypothetical protein HY909_12875 [Deltaproteobacteria bacterium]|nr:hypothetical protein [Deltaproteobacteria bacterium]